MQSKSQPFKMTFTKFVPVQKKKTQTSKPATDLKSMFGVEEEDSASQQDTSIKVNRKTNIHYAVHSGEKYTSCSSITH